jgi:hypothetical protein
MNRKSAPSTQNAKFPMSNEQCPMIAHCELLIGNLKFMERASRRPAAEYLVPKPRQDS